MRVAIARRFSTMPSASLPEGLLFVSAEPAPQVEGVRDRWLTLRGDRPEADKSAPEMLGEASAVVAVFDAFDKATYQSCQDLLEKLLAPVEVPPPVIALPMRPDGDGNDKRRLFEVLRPEDFARSCLDDLILGEPSGFELALAIRTTMARSQARMTRGDDELRRRDRMEQSLHKLRSSISCAMWQYLPTRLHLGIPPINPAIGDSAARQVAGYTIQDRLTFGVDEFVFRVQPPAGAMMVPAGEMVKIMPKSRMPVSIEALRRLDRFMSITQALGGRWAHPNIARCLQIYHSETCLYLRMELVGQESLFGRLKARTSGGNGLSPVQVRSTVAQLARAMNHLHTGPRICHRDLKPESVALAEADDGTITVKVVNFDTAAVQSGGSYSKLRSGTFPFVAPEVGEGRYDGMAGDMWSFGVVLCELACGAGSIERALGINAEPSSRRFPTQAVGMVRELLSDERRGSKFLSTNCWPEIAPVVPWIEKAVRSLNRAQPTRRWTSRELLVAAEESLGISDDADARLLPGAHGAPPGL